MNILALDVETGGFSADRHALTQLALVACTVSRGKAEPVATFVHNVRPAPGLLLEDDAMAIQGHTRATLLRRPDQLTEAQLIEQMKDFLASLGEGWECAPFVAHNGKFDHGFLDALCRRTSTPLPARDVFCTVERHKDLARRRIIAKPENNKLATLASLVDDLQEDVHDAGKDAIICARLFAWQEIKLAGTQSLIEGITADPVGLVYKHVPAATDGWWTKGPAQYPAKAPETSERRCDACGNATATWARQYRVVGARGGAGAITRFYACAQCKSDDTACFYSLGLDANENLQWQGSWSFLSGIASPATEKPKSSTEPAQATGPVFSCSKALVELHRRAKEGELPPLSGFRSKSGPIEDANRFVTGTFTVIREMLVDLERVNGAVIGTEKELNR